MFIFSDTHVQNLSTLSKTGPLNLSLFDTSLPQFQKIIYYIPLRLTIEKKITSFWCTHFLHYNFLERSIFSVKVKTCLLGMNPRTRPTWRPFVAIWEIRGVQQIDPMIANISGSEQIFNICPRGQLFFFFFGMSLISFT